MMRVKRSAGLLLLLLKQLYAERFEDHSSYQSCVADPTSCTALYAPSPLSVAQVVVARCFR
jgi:hypothetical protein